MCLNKMTCAITKKERMRRALWRQPVDRLPVQTNYTSAMGERLAAYFGCTTQELAVRMDNHLLRVDVAHTPRVSADFKVTMKALRIVPAHRRGQSAAWKWLWALVAGLPLAASAAGTAEFTLVDAPPPPPTNAFKPWPGATARLSVPPICHARRDCLYGATRRVHRGRHLVSVLGG